MRASYHTRSTCSTYVVSALAAPLFWVDVDGLDVTVQVPVASAQHAAQAFERLALVYQGGEESNAGWRRRHARVGGDGNGNGNGNVEYDLDPELDLI